MKTGSLMFGNGLVNRIVGNTFAGMLKPIVCRAGSPWGRRRPAGLYWRKSQLHESNHAGGDGTITGSSPGDRPGRRGHRQNNKQLKTASVLANRAKRLS